MTAVALVAIVLTLLFVLRVVLQLALFHPDHSIVHGPGREFSYAAHDGSPLVGYVLEAKDPKHFLIFFHGNTGNASYNREWISRIAEEDTTVFLPEYRGYGKSAGFPTPKRIVQDGLAGYDVAMSTLHFDPSRTIVYGESLGGAVAAQVLKSRRARAAILQSTFTSLHDMARRVTLLPLTYLLPSGRELNSVEALRGLNIPVLHLHGERDRTIPFRLGKRLHAALAGPKTWVAFPNAVHSLPTDQVLPHIRAFLSKL